MTWRPWPVAMAMLLAVVALGAGCATTYWPTPEELRAFEAAGPIEPVVDREQLLPGIPGRGPYRVVPGDLLEIRGARAFLGLGGAPGVAPEAIDARVSDAGTLTLPLVGELEIAGKTVTEIEAALIDALHPRYLRARPLLVVRVTEHQTASVAVLGAVERPGIHELRADQLSVFGALSQAGGILKASQSKVGARLIRVRRAEGNDEELVLPVKGLNVPVADVALAAGDTVEVELWQPALFTVVGLVQSPGAFEYPRDASYNLMQALALAGGVDMTANPPYATVFRKDAAGRVLAATFEIAGDARLRATTVEVRSGDVISVDHTVGSWTRRFLADVVNIQVGAVYGLALNQR
ncbi:MAG: polysaccharide biosynthesis/export family protein [Planctomycetota bacterium]